MIYNNYERSLKITRFSISFEGLRSEIAGDYDSGETSNFMASIRPMTPGFCHAIDLLKNLPDASQRRKSARLPASKKAVEVSSSKFNNAHTIEHDTAEASKESFFSIGDSNSTCVSTTSVAGEGFNSHSRVDDGYKNSIGFGKSIGMRDAAFESATSETLQLCGVNQQLQKSCTDLAMSNSSISGVRQDHFCTLPRTIPVIRDNSPNLNASKLQGLTDAKYFISHRVHSNINPPKQFSSEHLTGRGENKFSFPKINVISRNAMDGEAFHGSNNQENKVTNDSARTTRRKTDKQNRPHGSTFSKESKSHSTKNEDRLSSNRMKDHKNAKSELSTAC